MNIRLMLATALLLLGANLTSCGVAARTPGDVYPAMKDRRGALDIQVRLEKRRLRFVNTTPRVLEAGRIWLNGWYSAPVGDVPVGAAIEIPLTSFRDEHGERIRGGGFFAAEAPERITLAEYESSEGIFGLIVVGP